MSVPTELALIRIYHTRNYIYEIISLGFNLF